MTYQISEEKLSEKDVEMHAALVKLEQLRILVASVKCSIPWNTWQCTMRVPERNAVRGRIATLSAEAENLTLKTGQQREERKSL